MRIGWFSPVSAQTGIASYTQNVLTEMRALFPRDEVDLVVYHPPTQDRVLEMPYPMIALEPGLLDSDFHALFDVAVYHLGNNEKNHGPIYAALMRHPGVVVMHDYVYQHYLAGKSIEHGFVGPSYGNLVFSCGGPEAFDFLAASRVLRCDGGQVAFVPWESDWAVTVPFCDLLGRLGTGAVVHSEYARKGLGADYPGAVAPLFMPRPELEEGHGRPLRVTPETPLHLVFCGHIGGTKGLMLLTEAFIREPRLRSAFRVTVAGFGSDPDFLRQFRTVLAEQNLQSLFTLRIGLAEKDFQDVLASADVFFNLRFPNTEGASLSLAEQLAHGRPVIAYPTGCFAEMPKEAAFFLERIGDAQELADLMLDIDAGRDELAARGAAARAVVAEQTAQTYARGIVAFLRDNRDTLVRRAASATARRTDGVLPEIDPRDRAWTQAHAASHRLMQGLLDGTLFLPDGFFAAAPGERARLLALNLLHSRPADADLAALGALLDGLDLLGQYRLIGRLVALARMGSESSPLIQSYLTDLFLPDFDTDLWQALSQLDPRNATLLGLKALNLGGKDPAPVIEDTLRKGFRRTMRGMLAETGKDLADPEIAPLVQLLDQIDLTEMEDLDPVPLGRDLLAVMRSDTRRMKVVTRGFHDLEQIGIWTRSETARLFFRSEDDDSVTTLSGVVSLFTPAIRDRTAVTITVTEERSGRSATTQAVYEPAPEDGAEDGRAPGAGQGTAKPASSEMRWSLEPPGFSGPLSLAVAVEALHVPKEVIRVDDTRKLGALLQSLLLA